MRLDRRFVQWALGLLWLLDAGLQIQPFMFTREFATQVLAPNAAGQPQLVATPILWAVSLTSAHPVAADTAFALAQFAIALAILVPRTTRLGLALSIPWSLGVWLVGEGLGGLLTGHGDLLTGAPGAVILYAVLAIAAWPRRDGDRWRSDVPLPYWLIPVWAGTWLGFAALFLRPGPAAVGSVTGEIDMMAAMTPKWLSQLDSALSAAVGSAGLPAVIGLAALCAVIGLAVLSPGWPRRAGVVTGVALALVAGLVGQGFGSLFSGQATDPGSGPLLVLFAVCVLGASSAPEDGRLAHVIPATADSPAATGRAGALSR